MSWRLEITDGEFVQADLDLLDRLDTCAERYCQAGGVIFVQDQRWAHKRVLFGPGAPPAFLVSDFMLSPTQE